MIIDVYQLNSTWILEDTLNMSFTDIKLYFIFLGFYIKHTLLKVKIEK